MENQKSNLIHQFKDQPTTGIKPISCFIILLIVPIIGGLSGFFLARLRTSGLSSTTSKENKVKKVVGIVNKKTFRDKAEGVLKEGGIDGEGNFHLKRPGGESQNVYLTSTTVDLSQYINKKVRVWGETFKGEKAGWLMDVGLVEVLQ